MVYMIEFYYALIIAGIGFFLLNEFADMEIPFFVGFFFGLPYALVLWGVFGILQISEPKAFVAGFLIPMGLFLLVYRALITNKEFSDLIIGNTGKISVKTDLQTTGEVIVDTEWGRQFLLAKPSENQLKPLNKGDTVIIKDFNPPYAYVEKVDISSATTPAPKKRKAKPTVRWVFRKLFTRKKMTDHVCDICYGKIPVGNLEFCPFCGSSFHKDHFDAWVSARGSCPVCRSEIKNSKEDKT